MVSAEEHSHKKALQKTIEVEFIYKDSNSQEVKVTIKENNNKIENNFCSLEDFLTSDLGYRVCEGICKDILKIKNLKDFNLFDEEGMFIRQLTSEIFKRFFSKKTENPDIIISQYQDESLDIIYNPMQNLDSFYAIRSLIY